MNRTLRNSLSVFAILSVAALSLAETHPIQVQPREMDTTLQLMDPDAVDPVDEATPTQFHLNPAQSTITLSRFTGEESAFLMGDFALILDDPNVIVPAVVGNVGVSVHSALFVTTEATGARGGDFPVHNDALELRLDESRPSMGVYNFIEMTLSIEFYLTSPDGFLGPMPVLLEGTLVGQELSIAGANSVMDAGVELVLNAWTNDLGGDSFEEPNAGAELIDEPNQVDPQSLSGVSDRWGFNEVDASVEVQQPAFRSLTNDGATRISRDGRRVRIGSAMERDAQSASR